MRSRAARSLVAVVACACAFEAADAAPDSGFHALAIRGEGGVAALRASLGSRAFGDVLRLNRVDADHAARLDTLVVPDDPAALVDRTPFPGRVAALDTVSKLVVVANRVQAFAAYDSGRLVRWGPISSGGRDAPTRPGAYHVNWKLPLHRSTFDTTWVMPWAVNIDNHEGTALHQYGLPGHAASHCCVRLLEEDARWVYAWVDTWKLSRDGRRVLERGTPVRVVGSYDHDAPPPWRSLPVDPGADRLRPDEMDEAVRMGGEP
jgi:hypothetical protein